MTNSMKIQFDEVTVHLILHKPWKYELKIFI